MASEKISVGALQTLFFEGQFDTLVERHQTLPRPTPEDDYWAGFAYSAKGRSIEAIALLERSLNGGYIPAATLLASHAHDAKERERVRAYLDLLEPFDDLEPWHQAIAYREQGKFFEDEGRFNEAKVSYETSWNLLQQLPEAKILLGLAGQLLSWSYEVVNQSKSALEIIRKAKKIITANANRRTQLLYFQVFTAAQIGQFTESHEALGELETFVPNNPILQGFAFQAAGALARLEGHWMQAIEYFENTVVAASGTHSEIPVWANLFASHCSLALGDKAGAIAYIDRAENEFFAVDPFLAPAYALRCQANISLRRGALDVALGKPTAIDHLENARHIFAELGIPLGQCQCLLYLASWYTGENNTVKAVELIRESETFRQQIQDIGSYNAELTILPNLKPIFEIAARDERVVIPEYTDHEEHSSDYYDDLLESVRARPDVDVFYKNLRRLVIAEAFDEAKKVFEGVNEARPLARGWAGLTSLMTGDYRSAYLLWSSDAGDEFKKEFSLLRSVAKFAAQESQKYPIHFLSVFGKPEVFLVREEGMGANKTIKRERISFKSPKTYKLLSLLIEHHGNGCGGMKHSEIMRIVWNSVPSDIAEEEFDDACAELNALGKRVSAPLPQFVVKQAAETDKYLLVDASSRSGFRLSRGERKEIDELPILYLPFEFETQRGFGDITFIWMLSNYQSLFEGANEAWVFSKKTSLELGLLERGANLVDRLLQEGDEDAAMLLAKSLSALGTLNPLLGPDTSELSQLARQLTETDYVLPGAIRLEGTAKVEPEILEELELELKQIGWQVHRPCKVAKRKLSDLEQLQAEIRAVRLGENGPSEEPLEIISTRLIPEAALSQVIESIIQRLEQRQITHIRVFKP